MTKLGLVRSSLLLVPVVLVMALGASQAGAQALDTKGDKELTQLTQKIDKNAAARDGGRVTATIVDEWKGTRFKFDATSAPRTLTTEDVRDLRAKKLGYGEISTLLALTAKQPNSTTAKSLDQILAMRQAGEGWGELARNLGYRHLGSVVKRVQETDRGVTKVALQQSEKPDKSGSMDKPDKPEKPAKAEKPGR